MDSEILPGTERLFYEGLQDQSPDVQRLRKHGDIVYTIVVAKPVGTAITDSFTTIGLIAPAI